MFVPLFQSKLSLFFPLGLDDLHCLFYRESCAFEGLLSIAYDELILSNIFPTAAFCFFLWWDFRCPSRVLSPSIPFVDHPLFSPALINFLFVSRSLSFLSYYYSPVDGIVDFTLDPPSLLCNHKRVQLILVFYYQTRGSSQTLYIRNVNQKLPIREVT